VLGYIGPPGGLGSGRSGIQHSSATPQPPGHSTPARAEFGALDGVDQLQGRGPCARAHLAAAHRTLHAGGRLDQRRRRGRILVDLIERPSHAVLTLHWPFAEHITDESSRVRLAVQR
jgi:hypothetical protein